jgi:hypothetical protein
VANAILLAAIASMVTKMTARMAIGGCSRSVSYRSVDGR